MEKYLCIHGHFYQPPRENPWLEAIEVQDSAAPFHDWNERIASECYARNATARILDGAGQIRQIVNNYARISFNFGPTLLMWMKEKMPEVHAALVAADQESRQRFSGHGSAVAQNFNHMIMPLANARDKETQVVWGIRDFEHRFGRKPEGMWLAETAADTPTLEVLAAHGIKYTILSPFQASQSRRIGESAWTDVNGARIDPTQPYQVNLPSGKSLAVFFYDAPVSQAIAFEKLLDSGEKFAQKITGAFADHRDHDQLVHIATDGESYGHHHRYGEMALAYALDFIESKGIARLTNYGEFLEKHPPTHEVKIHEGSAWSCSHGVGRWKENCGCNSGGHGDWNQEWRAPLRQALDWLRDELSPLFEKRTAEFVKDPWAARNDYISIVLDRSPESLQRFFCTHARRELSEADQVTVLKLMEIQRHAMLMYTSCGWFFDELSGIETVQVIQYASRAIQLAREVLPHDFEPGFLERLEKARSNIKETPTGRQVYERHVKPAEIDWEKIVAHYALSSAFQNYHQRERLFVFYFDEQEREEYSAGKVRLVVGRTKLTFDVTRESDVLSYAVLYMGEHNLTGGVARLESEPFRLMARQVKEAFNRGDFPETIRLIDRHFGQPSYSLKSLFKDEQRRILNDILASTREDLENRYRLVTERYTPLMRFLADFGAPLPAALQSASDFILHADIRNEFASDHTNVDQLRRLIAEAQARNVAVLDSDLGFLIKNRLESGLRSLREKPGDIQLLDQLERVTGLVRSLGLETGMWRVRNLYWEMLQANFPEFRDKAQAGDEEAKKWTEQFLALGDHVGFAVRHLQS